MQAARLEIDDAGAAPAETTVTPPMPPAAPVASRRRLAPWLAAAVLLGGFITGAFVWRVTRPPPPEVLRFSVTPAPGQPIAIETNHHDVAILPDGRGIVYFSHGKDENQLIVRRFDRFEGTALSAATLGMGARGVFVSPDGQWLGFQTGPPGGNDARLVRAPTAGGAPVPIADVDGNLRGASWGADGGIVFATSRFDTGLWRVRAAGGQPEPLTRPNTSEDEGDHVQPRHLPGGTHLLFAIQRASDADGFDVALLSIATRTWRVLIENGTSPRYLSSGHIVYGAAGALMAVPFDLDRLQVTGDPIEVQGDVPGKPFGAVNYDVSAGGTLVYMPGRLAAGARRLAWRDADGRETPTGVSLPENVRLKLSPDGRFAAAVVGLPDRGLWVVDLTRGISTRLPAGEVQWQAPIAWTPDGRQIAFSQARSADLGLLQIAASGTTAPEQLTTASAQVYQAAGAYTPDGRHLLIVQGSRGLADGDVLRVTPGPTPVVTPLLSSRDVETAPALSPDGRWLAYLVIEAAPQFSRVYIRPYPNVGEARVPISFEPRNTDPVWSLDGRELFYQAFPGPRLMAVRVEPGPTLVVSKPIEVLSLAEPGGGQVPVAPLSSRRVLVARREARDDTNALEYRVVLNWLEELKARTRR
jgi:Tol biopolymer transport system component